MNKGVPNEWNALFFIFDRKGILLKKKREES